MSRRNQPDHDVVKVHVTPRGGLYVNERELLRSTGAREVMAKMGRILQRENRGSQSARRPDGGGQTQAVGSAPAAGEAIELAEQD